MPLIVRQHNYVAGALIIASQNNTNENTLYNVINGNLDEDNIASLGESVITFDTSGGHDHDGSNSKKIDISGAGFLLQCATTGTDHAIIGTSSSSGAHAGVSGAGSTSTAYGVYSNHTNASGTGLLAEASGGGTPLLVQNASGVAGNHALIARHRGTTASRAAVFVDDIGTNGWGVRIEDDASSSGTTALSVDGDSNTQTAVVFQGRNQVLELTNDVNSATSVQILKISSSGTSVQPDTNGWVLLDGTNLSISSSRPMFVVLGSDGTGADITTSASDADGPTGGTAGSSWPLKVRNSLGGANDNALFSEGYSRFEGNVYVAGDLDMSGTASATVKAFKITHPQDEAKWLRHASVESPEMRNVYEGELVLDRLGKGKVRLPDYFMSLNRNFRYQLTGLGPGDLWVRSEIDDEGVFEIRSSCPNQKVWWQVTGERKDKWALENPLKVEESK